MKLVAWIGFILAQRVAHLPGTERSAKKLQELTKRGVSQEGKSLVFSIF